MSLPIKIWLAVLAIGLALIASTIYVGASEVRCYRGFCAQVINGVVHVPREVIDRMTLADRVAARLYARRNGIKWRVVEVKWRDLPESENVEDRRREKRRVGPMTLEEMQRQNRIPVSANLPDPDSPLAKVLGVDDVGKT